jgi:APA family basic amino acid/polyamine antiporter
VFLVIQTGSIAAVAVAFAKFLGVLVPALGTGEEAQLFKPLPLNIDIPLPLPWLTEPLSIFKRTEFTVTSGQLVAVGVVALLTALNCRGVQEGKWVQNTFTLAKTAALMLLIAVGLTVAANPDAVRANFTNPWEGAATTEKFLKVREMVGPAAPALLVVLMVAGGAMVGSLFSADAWNNVTFTAGEVRNPRRTLAWSLLLGTGMVIALYLLANVAYLSVLPVRGDAQLAAELKQQAEAAKTPEARAEVDRKYRENVFRLGIDQAHNDRVGTAALQLASPNLGVPFMALAIMVSTFGCVNGMILMGARLYYAMARDGLFFQSVGGLNRRAVPAAGLVLQGVWSVLLIFSGTYTELLDYVIFAALMFYVLTVTGLFVLRRTRPDAERPYRAFGYPVIPAVYVLLCAVIMLNLLVVRPEYTWPGLIIVLAGIPVYFLWRLFGKPAKA